MGYTFHRHVFLMQDPMCEIVAMFWMVFQPLLFGLIGAEVNISQIDGGTVGRRIFISIQMNWPDKCRI